MTKGLKYIFGLVAFAMLVISCGVSSDGDNRFKAKPAALAKMNEVVVVTDPDIWDSIVGDTIDYLFSSPYPITPSPEPTFDLRYYTVDKLDGEPLLKTLRTYLVVANLQDEDSKATQFVKKDLGEERFQRALTDPTFHTSIGRDKWAVGQIIIYVFANGMDQLADAVADNYAGIAKKVNEHDAEQLNESVYSYGTMKPAIAKIKEASGGATVKIPNDYQVVLDSPEENNLMWFARDTRKGRTDIVVRVFDYEGPESISKENIKKNYNVFGSKVKSDKQGDYMRINDEDLPILEFEAPIGGKYAKEYRGIWEMAKEFMGGPFLSYAIVDGNSNKFIQIDAFVLAEGKDKRDLLQQLDHIAKSTVWE